MKERRITCLHCGNPLTKTQVSKRNQFCCRGCAVTHRQMAHDPDIFNIENEDMLYYLLGLIFTDGNLDKDESRITLSLTQQDIIQTLYPYMCDIEKRIIYEYTPKNCEHANTCYTILNTNIETISKLKSMTLTPHNSATKDLPNFPARNIAAFLRGVFDGDGTIINSSEKYGRIYKKVIITCASPLFVDKLVLLLQLLGLHPRVVIDSRRKDNEVKTYYISLNRQAEIKKFHDIIYNDNATIWMNYKRLRFE